MNVPGYTKILHLGDPRLDGLLDGEVVVQEKIDGSQISFCWDGDGQFWARSKGKVQWSPDHQDPDQMFRPAIEYLLRWTWRVPQRLVFRAEMMNGPKHNTLTYSRQPKNGLVLYDVEQGGSPRLWADADDIAKWADELGIEPVRQIFRGPGFAVALWRLKEWIAKAESQLGGTSPEGVVVKNYSKVYPEGSPWAGKLMAGKYVTEEFKEKHTKNPDYQKRSDFLMDLVDAVNTEARWRKAVQYLRDEGKLTGTPSDIGSLMKRVQADIMEEEGDWLQKEIVKHFMPKVRRGFGRGLPQWYKDFLIEQSEGGAT